MQSTPQALPSNDRRLHWPRDNSQGVREACSRWQRTEVLRFTAVRARRAVVVVVSCVRFDMGSQRQDVARLRQLHEQLRAQAQSIIERAEDGDESDRSFCSPRLLLQRLRRSRLGADVDSLGVERLLLELQRLVEPIASWTQRLAREDGVLPQAAHVECIEAYVFLRRSMRALRHPGGDVSSSIEGTRVTLELCRREPQEDGGEAWRFGDRTGPCSVLVTRDSGDAWHALIEMQGARYPINAEHAMNERDAKRAARNVLRVLLFGPNTPESLDDL